MLCFFLFFFRCFFSQSSRTPFLSHITYRICNFTPWRVKWHWPTLARSTMALFYYLTTRYTQLWAKRVFAFFVSSLIIHGWFEEVSHSWRRCDWTNKCIHLIGGDKEKGDRCQDANKKLRSTKQNATEAQKVREAAFVNLEHSNTVSRCLRPGS